MDWITGIQRALDYTEAHLTGEVDYEKAAKAACSSPFTHFSLSLRFLPEWNCLIKKITAVEDRINCGN